MLVRGTTYQDRGSPSTAPTQPDEVLIASCLAGDERSWEALIVRYSRLIYSVPFRHGLSDAEASDIFQTVCLKLLENLHSLRECEKLSSWLITTTSRECWSTIRKRTRFTQKDNGTEDEDREALDLSPLPEEVAVLLEEQQAVREAFHRLPSRCQQLLWYLFYDRSDPTYAEIANRLGMPGGSIGPWRARCLGKMRTFLEDAE